MAEERKVAIFGTFDVSNYGDLLFPIVAAGRLIPYGYEVLPVSPTTGGTVFADALPPTAFDDLLRSDPALDGVLIGGGEITHAWRGDFLTEYRGGTLPQTAYPSLWFGAGVIGALADAPIAWNAPGVPVPVERRLRKLALQPLIAASSYVSVRDDTSAAFIGRPAGVHVVPDTVADLARVWPKPTLEPLFAAFRARAGIPAEARLLAIHTRPGRIAPDELAAVAEAMSGFATVHGFTLVMVGIGPSLDDHVALDELARSLTVPSIVLGQPESLAELAAVIAYCELYLGTSMHGYVTAAAYDTPGVIVARPGFRKYAGFADHIGRRDDVVRSWGQGFARGAELLAAPQGRLIPDSVHAALDAHWQNIADAFAARPAKADQRVALLRHLVVHSATDLGLVGLAASPLAAF